MNVSRMGTSSNKPSGKRKLWLRAVGWAALAAGVVLAAGVAQAWPALGTKPADARLARIEKSPQYRGGKFVDTIPRVDPDIMAASLRWFKGVEHSQPASPIAVLLRQTAEFAAAPSSGLRITWFGHSSLLVEIEGKRLLLDPVWSERCSPTPFMGPKRFHPVPIALGALPQVDAVLISHDHYDHLDYNSIIELAKQNPLFVVPLGIGAHLEYWGISKERIRELDWWEETALDSLRLVATPARHFSGRGLGADQTLWAGWAMIGAQRRAYYSGDTAMFEGFAQIGERLGPFDATMIESGAYDAMWADVHLGPEQAIAAHRAVRGNVLFPVHWGTFDLALHTWVEPIERVLAAAQAARVTVVSPKPGQSIDPLAPPPTERWWPTVPWKKASEAPVVSSGLAKLSANPSKP
jgi:L-ascorbate metabolism protein UlaG (beta-lactamase superfamily)